MYRDFTKEEPAEMPKEPERKPLFHKTYPDSEDSKRGRLANLKYRLAKGELSATDRMTIEQEIKSLQGK